MDKSLCTDSRKTIKLKRLLTQVEVPSRLSAKEIYKFLLDTNQRIDGFEHLLGRVTRKTDRLCMDARRSLEKIEAVYKQTADILSSFEESMLYIMHNVKKNQFLYSHYPDDWVKNYQDVKEGLEKENEEMDQKING